MAGDWIPFRKDLEQQPEVISICAQTGLTMQDVVFRLLKLWSWADNTTTDGQVQNLVGVVTHLSLHCSLLDQRFIDAVVAVGWLRRDGDRFEFSNFDRWMGNSAKKRLMGAIRQRNSRLIRKAREIIDASTDAKVAELSRNCPSNVTPTVQDNTVTLSPLPSPSPVGGMVGGVVTPGERQTESEKPEPKKAPAEPPAAPTTPTSLRALPCDHPEAAAAAKRVVQHYQRVVRPATPPGGGIEAVLGLLVSGQTEERLRASADRYAAWCSRHDREPRFREAARTFFGPRGQLEVFLEGDPEQPAPSTYTPPPRRAAPREKPGQPIVLLRDLMAKNKPITGDPANAVAQIDQEARSAVEATITPSGTMEGSNGR